MVNGSYINVDWRTRINASLVPKVTDQGYCGSCWAHAGANVLRYAFAFVLNEQVTVSIQ